MTDIGIPDRTSSSSSLSQQVDTIRTVEISREYIMSTDTAEYPTSLAERHAVESEYNVGRYTPNNRRASAQWRTLLHDIHYTSSAQRVPTYGL